MDAYAGAMSCPDEMVRARLEAVSFPRSRYVIHKGYIEQLLREDARLPEVSFCDLDFDFYEPTRPTLAFLDSVTPLGAMIIVDDYGFFSTGAKTAVDELRDRENLWDCL